MNLNEIVAFVERLNLSHHKSLIGANFPEILALLSIVFGGSFLLYGWRHHEYFLGVTGLLVGGWAGLLLRTHVSPTGGMPPFVYMAVCAAAGAFIGAYCRHFVGILLGGFTAALVASVFAPALFRPGEQTMLTMCLVFLLGGGLGGLFPKLFFIFNSSLIGAAFVTFGVSTAAISPLAPASSPMRVVVHLAVFLPLFLFGMIHQGLTSRNEAMRIEAAPRPARPRAAGATAE